MIYFFQKTYGKFAKDSKCGVTPLELIERKQLNATCPIYTLEKAESLIDKKIIAIKRKINKPKK